MASKPKSQGLFDGKILATLPIGSGSDGGGGY